MSNTRDYAGEYAQLRLQLVGHYESAKFALAKEWKPRPVVYVWSVLEAGLHRPVRVGETLGLGGRHSSYNSWIGGRRRLRDPWRDAVEQEKARLARLRLGTAAQVWAVVVSDKKLARSVEGALMALWRPALDINFDIPESWASRELSAWRKLMRSTRPAVT